MHFCTQMKCATYRQQFLDLIKAKSTHQYSSLTPKHDPEIHSPAIHPKDSQSKDPTTPSPFNLGKPLINCDDYPPNVNSNLHEHKSKPCPPLKIRKCSLSKPNKRSIKKDNTTHSQTKYSHTNDYLSKSKSCSPQSHSPLKLVSKLNQSSNSSKFKHGQKNYSPLNIHMILSSLKPESNKPSCTNSPPSKCSLQIDHSHFNPDSKSHCQFNVRTPMVGSSSQLKQDTCQKDATTHNSSTEHNCVPTNHSRSCNSPPSLHSNTYIRILY